MCGIVGYIGDKQATDIIMTGLHRLEYRGYDSAGVAVIKDGKLDCIKSLGKLNVLDTKLEENPLESTLGIGHTRWATHGVPSEVNSHPHFDGPKEIAVVHNGIIENYRNCVNNSRPKASSFAARPTPRPSPIWYGSITRATFSRPSSAPCTTSKAPMPSASSVKTIRMCWWQRVMAVP